MNRIDDDDTDRLRDLAQQLPYERPDAERREAVRSSLLVAAAQPARSNRRWLLAGGGFLAGALAAAAIAIVVISPRESTSPHAKIDAPPTAQLEHVVSKTETGTDELVRIRAGVVRLSVPAVKRGDRVRTQTSDAEIEGTGSYEVAVVDDKLQRVTVDAGTARIDLRVDGKQQQVFLAAGETWRPTVITASIDPPAPGPISESRAASQTEGASQIKAASQTEGASQSEGASQIKAASQTEGASQTEDASQTEGASQLAAKPNPNVPAANPNLVEAKSNKSNPSVVDANANRSNPNVVATKPNTTEAKPNKSNPNVVSATPNTIEPTPNVAKPNPAEAKSPRLPAVTTLDPPPTFSSKMSKTEQHFQRGWKLLRDGHAAEAAVELAAAADADANDPLAADARYFQAIALVRSGKSADAERVLVAFLDRAPTSLRRGRAAILLGKLLRDRGDAKSARAWFESALADGDPAIAAAAKAHLDALSPRR